MGKTRLARAAARRFVKAGRFADGVYFVPLAAIEQSTQVVTTIADAIDWSFGRNRPCRATHHRPAPQSRLSCARQRGADRGLPDLLPRLLRDMPQTTFLLTSRAVAVAVRTRTGDARPAIYSIEQHHDTGGGSFHGDRSACAPDFAPDSAELNRICGLVEGMPLALELAAGWVDTLSLPAIEAAIREDSGYFAYRFGRSSITAAQHARRFRDHLAAARLPPSNHYWRRVPVFAAASPARQQRPYAGDAPLAGAAGAS